ncbi:MAG: hypothetical protein WC315_00245 [Candidatus Omnitrophota bacterium]|jgi:hypothetical protein
MRLPHYLSPSQIALWYSDRDEYYLRHLAEMRVQAMPQATYMSIGASFDAYVKSAMFETIFGKGADPRFEFDAIFTDQVDEVNRDWAKEHGKYVFESYKLSGAYDELLSLLQQSKYAPQFEFKIEGTVENVPLLGKPDLRFVHPLGAHVILDWKVNGYCSRSATSPCKNYRLVRDGWTAEVAKASRGANSPHKDYKPMDWKGVEIHNGWLEEANSDWADQLAIYSWMLGEAVGDENVIVCIDQVVAKPNEPRPLLRIANHRARISSVHQQNLMRNIQACWTAITTGYIFDDLTREENDEKCALLEQQAIRTNIDTPEQQCINDLTRQHRFK